MKSLFAISALLIVGCIQSNEDLKKIDSIGSSEFYAFKDSAGSHKGISFIDGVYAEEYAGDFIYTNSSGCYLTKEDRCERLICNSDSVSRSFCNIKRWSVDSLSFDLNGSTYTGRFY